MEPACLWRLQEDHTRALSKEDPHEASVAAFFRGAVPRVVLSSARRAMPHDLDLLLQVRGPVWVDALEGGPRRR